jgi:hypothetical protein
MTLTLRPTVTTQVLEHLVLSQQEQRAEFIETLIKNSEKYREPSVARARSRTLEEIWQITV